MSRCKDCMKRGDCWIKNVVDMKTRYPDDPGHQDIVMKASRGDCPCYEEEE